VAVTYAQFIVDYPEYSALAQTTVQSRLTFWNGFLEGFAAAHDEAVYRRSALDLSERVFSLPMDRAEGGEDRYRTAWERFLYVNYRRGQVSGGGFT
jgi:hypothetical protein